VIDVRIDPFYHGDIRVKYLAERIRRRYPFDSVDIGPMDDKDPHCNLRVVFVHGDQSMTRELPFVLFDDAAIDSVSFLVWPVLNEFDGFAWETLVEVPND